MEAVAGRSRTSLRTFLVVPTIVAVACSAGIVPLSAPTVTPQPVADCALGEGRSARSQSQASTPGGPLIAVVWDPHEDRDALAALDPVTLRRLSPRLPLGEQAYHPYAFSPDGSQVAVGGASKLVRIFDIAPLSLARTLPAPGGARALSWPSATSLVGISGDGVRHDARLLRWDLGTGAVRRSRFDGAFLAGEPTTDGALVVLLAPDLDAGTFGPPQLVVVDSNDARTVTLDALSAGFEIVTRRHRRIGYQRIPALAVDPSGEHAYVTGRGEPVASVALDTLEVEYHAPAPKTSLLGALAGLFQSPAEAKGGLEANRSASFGGPGLLFVTGFDARLEPGEDFPQYEEVDAEVVDTRTWSSCRIPDVTDVVATADEFVIFDESAMNAHEGVGLTAYGWDGSRRWHLFASHPTIVSADGGLLYVQHGWKSWHLATVEANTGRILHDAPLPMPQLLTPP